MEEFSLDWVIAALKTIPDIIRQPAANFTAAVLLLALFSTLLAMAAVGLLMVIVRPRQSHLRAVADDPKAAIEHDVERDAAKEEISTKKHLGDSGPVVARRLITSKRISAASLVILVLLGAWLVGGITSQERMTCESCHPDNPHAPSAQFDPHASVRCVECHEDGSTLSRTLFSTPARFEHFVRGQLFRAESFGYGLPVSSTSCRACHSSALAATLVDENLGIRMSHPEPLDAGAECVDCHALASGIVSSRTTGMSSCLRCHDNEVASAECSYCHTGDPAQAVRSERPEQSSFAKAQVPNPSCDSCHDQAAEGCDGCHGIRMPHTPEFMAYRHALPGVIDLWTNGGRTCGKCHTENRRPCTQCHTTFLAHAITWRYDHSKGTSFTNAGCTCHDRLAYKQGRNFCEVCHQTKPRRALP